MEGKIKVVIADDHRLFREMLRLALHKEKSIKIVGEAATAERCGAIARWVPNSPVAVRRPCRGTARRASESWHEDVLGELGWPNR